MFDGLKGINVVVLLLATGTTLPTVAVFGTTHTGCHSRITPRLLIIERLQMLCSAHGCFVRSGSLPLASEMSDAMTLHASTSIWLYGIERGSGGPVALDHGDYVLYDIGPTQPVEVVELPWFRAQSS